MLGMPASDGECAITVWEDAVAGATQVQEMRCPGVSPYTAPIGLAQIFTAYFSRPGHVGDVLAQSVSQKCSYSGAVLLQ